MRIKQIRESLVRLERGLSQEELANRLGMNARTLRRRELDGELLPEEISKLAEISGCDVSWIVRAEGRGPAEAGPERQIQDYLLAAHELWQAHYGEATGAGASAAGARLQHFADLLRRALHRAQQGAG